ncbi:MAG: DUF2330 domain-containing protein [Actinobacteria bacterium]|nr:DUF2330 domain-containing protein [Actinomycetota bacterium]
MSASAAYACGGLIGPNGSVNLLRTTTMAGYANGVEHYVTSFSFAGGGGEFGSLVPLPDVPTTVERGGDWTLQRLIRETQPQPVALARDGVVAAAAESAEVILETTIDALEITVVKGGGDEVGRWAKENGFNLPPDAPEVLDFYAERSPIFMAARFDAEAARERGQNVGEGTPIHLSIPTDNPWVPLRILALGKQPQEQIQADVYLLTEGEPQLSPLTSGVQVAQSRPASKGLVSDLASDRGMDWIPKQGMWLSYLRVDAPAAELTYDLAANVHGGQPSPVAAGLASQANESKPGTAPTPKGEVDLQVAQDRQPTAPESGPPAGPVTWMLAGGAAGLAGLIAVIGRRSFYSA